jgi:Fe-S cluster assembly protein SufD
VLVNGRWSPALSSLTALPAGVTVRSFRDAVETATPKTAPEWLLKASAGMPFVDLNTAFADDGVVIDIAAKAVVTDPIHVVCLNTQAQARPGYAARADSRGRAGAGVRRRELCQPGG